MLSPWGFTALLRARNRAASSVAVLRRRGRGCPPHGAPPHRGRDLASYMRHGLHLIVGMIALLGCEHGEPFVTSDQTRFEPFSPTPPVRLTFASNGDVQPNFSEDGQFIVYSYLRRTSDLDRCLGVLPATGGSRLREICPDPEAASSRDVLSSAALASDGRVVYNRHASAVTSPLASSGTLELAAAEPGLPARILMPLHTVPAGATARWDNLLSPVWVGADRFVALAAREGLGSWVTSSPPEPRDTLYTGSAVVEVTIGENGVTWRVLVEAPGASMLAVDREAGLIYFLRSTRFPGAPDENSRRSHDSVFRAPLGGGMAEPLFGMPRAPDEEVGGIVGLAAGGGRLFLAENRGSPAPGSGLRPAGSESSITEWRPDGPPITLDFRDIVERGRWRRIAVSPDGSRLVAELESVLRQTDLYLFTTP